MKFQVFKGANGDFYWRLRADNNEPIASSEGYRNKADCLHSIELVKGSAAAPVVDLTAFGNVIDAFARIHTRRSLLS